MKPKLLLATVLALLAAQPRGQAQLIANGSFESPMVEDEVFSTPTAWMWNREFPPPPVPGRLYRTNAFPFTFPDGAQCLGIFSYRSGGDRLSQQFTVTNPGSYQLRWHDKDYGRGTYSVAVLAGAVEVASQTNSAGVGGVSDPLGWGPPALRALSSRPARTLSNSGARPITTPGRV